MPIDTNALTEVLGLAQACEDVARSALGVAQNQLRTKAIAQEVFDRAFQDYGLAMQKARDMYYQASHGLAQQIMQSADLKRLSDQTAALKQALEHLKTTEHVLSISFGVVTLVAAVATAVTMPGSESLEAALSAVGTLSKAISG
jgi:hypothetical protein